jgi:hypothetical protein
MYSNIPVSSETNSTLTAFDQYNKEIVEINPTALAVIKAFFTSKGFGEVAADTISSILIIQCKNDGYNPMVILDSLKGLESVELSGIVAEILNYNRFKSSSLGYAQPFQTTLEVSRNILA